MTAAVPSISNKTQKPLRVPLPRGKVLHLGPGKTGQISSDAADHPPLKALVDGGTIERGTDGGLNAGIALAKADGGSFLEASGDLIQTGPTGTNVMDLMLGLRV